MKQPTKLTVRGGTAADRKLIRHAAAWMLVYELGPRLAKNVTTTITLSKSLLGRTSSLGECDYLDNPRAPRFFHIAVSLSQIWSEVIRTLAHEIVHVRQFARNDMYDLAKGRHLVRWRGRNINYIKTPHHKLPWEIEAERLQDRVYRAYRLVQKDIKHA